MYVQRHARLRGRFTLVFSCKVHAVVLQTAPEGVQIGSTISHIRLYGTLAMRGIVARGSSLDFKIAVSEYSALRLDHSQCSWSDSGSQNLPKPDTPAVPIVQCGAIQMAAIRATPLHRTRMRANSIRRRSSDGAAVNGFESRNGW